MKHHTVRIVLHMLIISLLVLCYLKLDVPLAAFLHQHPIAPRLWQPITRLGISTVYLIVLGLGVLLGFRYSGFLLLGCVIPSLICDAIKIIVSRARPIIGFTQHQYGFYFFKLHAPYWSFPSGHTVFITSLMLSVAYCWPKLRYYAIALALIVSTSRVMITAHYLSDVLSSFYLIMFMQPYLLRLLSQKLLLKIPRERYAKPTD